MSTISAQPLSLTLRMILDQNKMNPPKANKDTIFVFIVITFGQPLPLALRTILNPKTQRIPKMRAKTVLDPKTH